MLSKIRNILHLCSNNICFVFALFPVDHHFDVHLIQQGNGLVTPRGNTRADILRKFEYFLRKNKQCSHV